MFVVVLKLTISPFHIGLLKSAGRPLFITFTSSLDALAIEQRVPGRSGAVVAATEPSEFLALFRERAMRELGESWRAIGEGRSFVVFTVEVGDE